MVWLSPSFNCQAVSTRFIIVRVLSAVNTKVIILSVFVTSYSFGVLILSVLDKICALLDQQGKKQKDLTDFLGISKNAFTDWKSGRIRSYTKHLPKIAEFLGVSVDYLLGVETKNTPDEQILTEGEKLWLDLYHQLSTETRAVLVNMANAFETLPCDRQKFLLDAIRFAVENQK